MNWTQERDPQRRVLLDALVRSNRAVWEGFSLDANLTRVSALREALEAAFRDDAERLRAFAGRDFPGWTV